MTATANVSQVGVVQNFSFEFGWINRDYFRTLFEQQLTRAARCTANFCTDVAFVDWNA